MISLVADRGQQDRAQPDLETSPSAGRPLVWGDPLRGMMEFPLWVAGSSLRQAFLGSACAAEIGFPPGQSACRAALLRLPPRLSGLLVEVCCLGRGVDEWASAHDLTPEDGLALLRVALSRLQAHDVHDGELSGPGKKRRASSRYATHRTTKVESAAENREIHQAAVY